MPSRIGQGRRGCCVDGAGHRARRLDGVRSLDRVVDRRAENGERPSSRNLFTMPLCRSKVKDFENGVEARDDLGRRAGARGRGEAADVDEHHADPPHFAKFGGADH